MQMTMLTCQVKNPPGLTPPTFFKKHLASTCQAVNAVVIKTVAFPAEDESWVNEYFRQNFTAADSLPVS